MERRVAKRFSILRDATIDGAGAIVENISRTGAYVLSHQVRHIGERVELRFQTDSARGLIDWECLGEIRRTSVQGVFNGLGIQVDALNVSDPVQLLNG